MKRVALVFTGGTISMQTDPVVGAAIPVLSGEQILATVPGLEKLAEYELVNFARLPGPHMTPGLMLELAEELRRLLEREDICGAVVTHGTDTLEETAYCLDLLLTSEKPVALVGAMRSSSEPGWDGPPNLLAAVRTVVCEQARGLGVVVVMNDEINAASEVTKTHTEALGTFQSPNFGPLGIVDRDRVLILRRPAFREHIHTDTIDTHVDIIKMAAGVDDRLINYAVESGTHGLVIEALGRGNIPSYAIPGVENAVRRCIPVVVVSRCLRGRVLDTYGYTGGGHELRQMGAILGGHLPGQKARIKLMLALGLTKDIERIRAIFEKNYY
ncbi:MAG: asparaginase [Acidobacteriota bacterium]|nr:asparaginase [Blastocatellia bacterium]MDW8413066.1 asparaginase [Acidobacteriota bacterium]